MGGQTKNEAPTLDEVLHNAIEARLTRMNIAIPGRILTFDGTRASVQPLLKIKFNDDAPIEAPTINNVPIMWPQSAAFSMTFPIVKDDEGLLLFSQRSLDKWLVSGGLKNPDDNRKFDYSDAMFLPQLRDFSNAPEYDENKAIIKTGTAKITMSKDGKVALGGSKELLDILDKINDEIVKTEAGIEVLTVPTVMGPSGVPINAATFTAIKNTLTTLKSDLAEIKGVL